MTSSSRSLLVPLFCVLALSACASPGPGASGDSGGTAATSTPTSITSSPGRTVAAVTLHRSGGLKPVTVRRVFAADQAPPKGYTEAGVHRTLAAAQAFVDAGAKVRPVDPNACCDLYSYQVVISLADGTSRSFRTVDGVTQPEPFETLLRALS
jgi:hypothetical protein